MKKKKFRCKQCGRCCVVWFSNGCCVTLSNKEVESKKYLARTMYGDTTALRKKTVYIPELGKKASCCVYLNVKTMQCKIQKDKPWICRKYTCRGSQEIVRWTLLESDKQYKF